MDYRQFRRDIIDELEHIASATTFIEVNMDELLNLAADQEQRIKELEYEVSQQEELINKWEARSEEYRLELAAALEKNEELEADLVRKDVDYGIIIDKLEDDLERVTIDNEALNELLGGKRA